MVFYANDRERLASLAENTQAEDCMVGSMVKNPQEAPEWGFKLEWGIPDV